jgi:hypothetical protein
MGDWSIEAVWLSLAVLWACPIFGPRMVWQIARMGIEEYRRPQSRALSLALLVGVPLGVLVGSVLHDNVTIWGWFPMTDSPWPAFWWFVTRGLMAWTCVCLCVLPLWAVLCGLRQRRQAAIAID